MLAPVVRTPLMARESGQVRGVVWVGSPEAETKVEVGN